MTPLLLEILGDIEILEINEAIHAEFARKKE